MLFEIVEPSSAQRYVVMFLPSSLARPFQVATHIKPRLSSVMSFTELSGNPLARSKTLKYVVATAGIATERAGIKNIKKATTVAGQKT